MARQLRAGRCERGGSGAGVLFQRRRGDLLRGAGGPDPAGRIEGEDGRPRGSVLQRRRKDEVRRIPRALFAGRRYSPAAKAQLEKSRDALKRGDKNAGPAGPAPGDVEIKKPGAANKWISRRGPAAADVLNVKAPAGGTPEPVAP